LGADIRRPAAQQLIAAMRRFARPLARPFSAVAFGLLLIGASPGQVPEPDGLWQGPMRGYTPNTVKGAVVLDTAGLAKLIEAGGPVLLDVSLADIKPPSMAPGTPWLPLHRSIPDAVWLPGAGSGSEEAPFAELFRSRVAQLAGGDISRPIVTFCHPECWGSWNAAKRLVGLGYAHVYWYPDGMEGWQAEHEVAAVKPDPDWAAGNPPEKTQ
jgi:PQQ-dependent catabolism-associated CXXCW motif protein